MQIKIKGIISYPHLFQARAVQAGDDPKFGCSILIHKTDPQVATMQQAIDTESANTFPTGAPANAKFCMNDCAVKFPDKPELADYMVINSGASADRKPQLGDINLQPLMDPSLVHAGDLAWFSLNTFGYNKAVSKGIAAGLNGVIILGEEGPLGKLGNTQSLQGMFGDFPTQGGPAAQDAPTAKAPPRAAPKAAPTPVPTLIMTAAAEGVTLAEYLALDGWTEELLISEGLAIRSSAS